MYSGTLSFYNGGFSSDIVTNTANILLDGTSGAPKFIDQNNSNALQNLALDSAAMGTLPMGTLTIQNGANLIVGATSGFTNAGSLTIGSTSTLNVGNIFTQAVTGILNLPIGSNPGNGYSQLVATGLASLDGTLNVSLVNGFTPYNGEEFVILTSTGLGGTTFSTVNGLQEQEGNVNFTVEYTSSDVPASRRRPFPSPPRG